MCDALDAEGFIRKKISGWCDGGFKEYYIEDGVDVAMNSGRTELKTGDIILLSVGTNTITDIKPMFDVETKTFQDDNYAYKEWQALSFLDGMAYSTGDGYISYTNTKNADGTYDYSIENINHITAATAASNAVEVDVVAGVLRPSSVDNLLGYTTA